MITQMKIKLNIIKISHIFQIIHTVILIIGSSASRKTNALLNLIENQPDIDKIYLYAKDPYESKYQYLINKREGVGIRMICMMFIKILMITIQIKKIKY